MGRRSKKKGKADFPHLTFFLPFPPFLFAPLSFPFPTAYMGGGEEKRREEGPPEGAYATLVPPPLLFSPSTRQWK